MRWSLADRSDPFAVSIFDRHYSRRTVGAPNVLAPSLRGLVLTAEVGGGRALWVSREQEREACRHAWPGSWECAVFRNEGAGLSSELVREAVAATLEAWGEPPEAGFLTFVNGDKTRRKRDPGRCFVKAGWRRLETRTKARGLVVLQLARERFGDPVAALGTQRALAWVAPS